MSERKIRTIPASKSEYHDNPRNVTPSIPGDSSKWSALNVDLEYDDACISEQIKGGKRKTVITDYEKKQPVKLEAATPNSEKIYKPRVCGYCRVSTDYREQETSIIAQREHYEQLIRTNSDWEFAGIYWEANESATEADTRPELQRLIKDCQAGLIDIILTKSISRFSRNVSDCLNIVRKLNDLGVTVRFEKEGIDTGNMESELMLSLYSAFAEEESKSISKNTQWSIKKRFETGTYKFSSAPFGYDLAEGTFVINEEKAEIVREIFNRMVAGEGTPSIARDLNCRGIPTGTKKRNGEPGKWSGEMIRGIIRNVAYIGDVLYQKRYMENFKQKNNYGERTQYYNNDHHKPIIDKLTFERANNALRQRSLEKGYKIPENRQARITPYHNRYPFSGKLICGCCGDKMIRMTNGTSTGRRIFYSCMNHLHLHTGECQMKQVLEQDVWNAFENMLNKLWFAKSIILDLYARDLRQNENDVVRYSLEKLNNQLTSMKSEKQRLTLLLQRKCGSSSIQQRFWDLEIRENSVMKEIEQIQNRSQSTVILSELRASLDKWKKGGDLETVFSELIESVTVMRDEYVIFNFKNGLILKEILVK